MDTSTPRPLELPVVLFVFRRLLKRPLGFYKSGKVATSRIETGVRSGQYKYYDHVK